MTGMNDKLNFDTVDILAGAIGAFIAFSVLPISSDRGTERIVVGLSVLLMVTIKRMFVPTKSSNPESSLIIRFLFLFIALIGTGFIVLALLGILGGVQEFREPMIKNAMFITGIFLLSIATLIDSKYLKRKK